MTNPESVIDRNREIVRKVYEIADRGAMAEHGQYMSDGYGLTQASGHPVPGHWQLASGSVRTRTPSTPLNAGAREGRHIRCGPRRAIRVRVDLLAAVAMAGARPGSGASRCRPRSP
jgi:hypothetical protein